jgi:HK97 family phage prohead protease
MNNKLEYRAISDFSRDGETRTIRGLAIPVEQRSEVLYGEIREMIMPSALQEELIQQNDVKLYVDHMPMRGTLARSKYGQGSLRLFITDKGLEFETELPDTELGNEILRGMERGDYDAMSFGFIVGNDHYDSKPDENGIWNRYIDNFKMLDEISILSQLPAYSQTEVSKRSLDEAKEALNKETELFNSLDAKMNEIEELAKVD